MAEIENVLAFIFLIGISVLLLELSITTVKNIVSLNAARDNPGSEDIPVNFLGRDFGINISFGEFPSGQVFHESKTILLLGA